MFLLVLAGMTTGPALAADTQTMTDQVTQRVISRGGAGQVTGATQQGPGNWGETSQSGTNNTARILQQGSGNLSVITQSGSNLSAESLQTAGARVRIDQTGAAGGIRVQQTGPGAGAASIFSSGAPVTVTVR
ncbi:hypothetical protein EAH89_15175 [Roseomonas nepalensis]|uniref:Curlin n=1 Tax=Muricoccus nepalensis TaxID=1854500 RepID=A0A502FWD2_9PROT|nr:hypothetical protein [Roseomonas nepalensis]TPG53784.1 hypothetical protein EAH89_15175 [Roseomonas nepalensis]